MCSANLDFSTYEEPEDPGRYVLTGANPIFEYENRFFHPKCSMERLQQEFAAFLQQCDEAFRQLSDFDDGTLITVHHKLVLPEWSEGRLTLFHESHSLEGREVVAEYAEDPAWKDSLLWTDEEIPNKRGEIFRGLRSSVHEIANEGLELFQLVTRKTPHFWTSKTQNLRVPVSEKNLIKEFLETDLQGRIAFSGIVGKTQNVDTEFRITLFNDVYRRDLSSDPLDDGQSELNFPEFND